MLGRIHISSIRSAHIVYMKKKSQLGLEGKLGFPRKIAPKINKSGAGEGDITSSDFGGFLFTDYLLVVARRWWRRPLFLACCGSQVRREDWSTRTGIAFWVKTEWVHVLTNLVWGHFSHFTWHPIPSPHRNWGT